MLNRFNSNAKKLNRIIPKINPNNLNDDLYITGSLLNIETPTTNKFNSNAKKLNRIIPKINPNNLNDELYITGSLLNIELPSSASYQSHIRSNPNSTKLVNNKNKISEFHNEILQFSGRIVSRIIDAFDNTGFGTLTIYNVALDYGTEGASPENFEILVYGLHIPGNYTIKEIGNNVVITLNDEYIDFDNVTIDDIYVIGKLVDIELDTEDDIDILTENDENIII
jgi:hypothetical protein